MKRILLYLILILFALLPLKSDFIKNDKIFKYEDGSDASKILFKSFDLKGLIYITESGLSLVPKRISENKEETHRVNIEFIDADFSSYSGIKSNTIVNYNGQETKNYQELTFHEIYDGIDLRFYTTSNNELEFDFILSEESDPKQIKLKVHNSEGYFINEHQEIEILTKISPLFISPPISYTLTGQSKNIIHTKYVKSDGFISIQLKSYNKNEKLIIDPITRFSGSYYGGNGNDTGYDVVYDSNKNYYINIIFYPLLKNYYIVSFQIFYFI